jgi:hypothetical protein
MNMPEELRAKLLAAGHSRIDIGNVELDLESGKISRTISLDGRVVAKPEFATGALDWEMIERALP